MLMNAGLLTQIYRTSGRKTGYKKSSLVYNRRATQKEKNVPRFIVQTNVAVSYHCFEVVKL